MSDVQVAIIGGGIMGVSLLYHLVKQGWRDVMLIEKSDLTHGSTWHAAGLCTHFAHHPTIQELRARSVRLYRDILPRETGQTCGFHACGAMRVTRSRARMDEFHHVAGLSQFTGYDLEVLTPDRIAGLHPLARLDGLVGGIYEPDDGHVDPTLATNAMAEVAVRAGAVIQRYSPVTAIERQAESWRLETATGAVTARNIVNAAGTWGWEVGQMMGLNIPSVPVLHQYVVTDTVPEIAARRERDLPELPIIRDPEESWYMRQEGAGFILGPYEKDAHVWSVDGCPPEFAADLLPADLERVEHIVEAALRRVPALANAGVKTVINGPITFTPDANPLIGPAHGLDNAWLLTGSSMGVMEGGGAGWFLAHWMTRGAPPMDALALDSRRFGAWADRDYRIAKAVECFASQFAIHFPHEERPAGRNVRLSPLHEIMVERGAVMGAVHGWERPNWFSTGAVEAPEPTFRRPAWFDCVAGEVDAVANRVGLADLSVFSKFELRGRDVPNFLNVLGANTPPEPGRIGLTHALTSAGGVAAEFTVAMLDHDHAYLTSAAAAEEMDLDLLNARAAGLDVRIDNRTEDLAVIGLMGPRSRQVLAKVADADLTGAMPWLSLRQLDVAGVETRVMRVSYVGEMGFELHLPRQGAREVFLALERAGAAFGIGYYGAYAANSMRLEKGYRAWGSELTSERTPLEAGLDHLVKTSGRDFIGRTAMLERQNPWAMVLLEIEADQADPFHAHPVLCDGLPVGIVTSAAYGHRCGRTLALAYLREANARQRLQVKVLNEVWPASILRQPPFDPTNARMKA